MGSNQNTTVALFKVKLNQQLDWIKREKEDAKRLEGFEKRV